LVPVAGLAGAKGPEFGPDANRSATLVETRQDLIPALAQDQVWAPAQALVPMVESLLQVTKSTYLTS
jgi:hypothetical protein